MQSKKVWKAKEGRKYVPDFTSKIKGRTSPGVASEVREEDGEEIKLNGIAICFSSKERVWLKRVLNNSVRCISGTVIRVKQLFEIQKEIGKRSCTSGSISEITTSLHIGQSTDVVLKSSAGAMEYPIF